MVYTVCIVYTVCCKFIAKYAVCCKFVVKCTVYCEFVAKYAVCCSLLQFAINLLQNMRFTAVCINC